jgi:CheY-like chemotaxis protein
MRPGIKVQWPKKDADATEAAMESEPTPTVADTSTPPREPASYKSGERTALPPPPADVAPTLRILFIDDSELVLAVREHHLRTAGFDVRTTKLTGEIPRLMEGWAPHLVLIDVMMPEVAGDTLCGEIKARFGGAVPIVLFSNLDKPALEERALACRADAYLSKSTDAAEFIRFVRSICAMTYSPDALPLSTRR